MAKFTLRAHYHREVGGVDVCETCKRPLDGVRRPVERFVPGDEVTITDKAEIQRLIKAGAIDDPDAPTTGAAIMAAADAEREALQTDAVSHPPAELKRPPKAGTQPAWVDYAVSRGLPRAEAETMSKEDLIAAVGD